MLDDLVARHVLRRDHGEHSVVAGAVVLVSGDHHDQPPTPEVGPGEHRGDLGLQPGVGGRERTVVGDVAQVGDDHAGAGQRAGAGVRTQLVEGYVVPVAGGALVDEVRPRVVLDGVGAGRRGHARAGHRLGVQARRAADLERASEHRGAADRMAARVVVVLDAEGRTAGDGEVVGQGRVGHRVVRRRVAVPVGERGRPRHLRAHLVERVVLDEEDEHLGRRYRGRGRTGGRLRRRGVLRRVRCRGMRRRRQVVVSRRGGRDGAGLGRRGGGRPAGPARGEQRRRRDDAERLHPSAHGHGPLPTEPA